MYWLNMIGTVAVGAVVVLAGIALFDIMIRIPRTRRVASERSADGSRRPAPNGADATRRREFKRSNGTDR
jgi:hypothetical protein